MAAHEYTPSQALNLLMNRIRLTSEDLADHIQGVIDSGQDITEIEHVEGRQGRPRTFRRTIALTTEDALIVAVEALRAYFIEQSLFANSTLSYFRIAGIGEMHLDQESEVRGLGEEKEVAFELGTETQISPSADPTRLIMAISDTEIRTQQVNLDAILELVDFT